MAARIVVVGHALACPREPRERHAWPAAFLQLLARYTQVVCVSAVEKQARQQHCRHDLRTAQHRERSLWMFPLAQGFLLEVIAGKLYA